MLTGKCKEEFEKWYVPNRYVYTLVQFYNLPKSMQWGVYQDYFDSVGINVGVNNDIRHFDWWVDSSKNYSGKDKTRQEARYKAIEKANEIRNEQLK